MGHGAEQELELLTSELVMDFVKAAKDGDPLRLACRELVLILSQPRPHNIVGYVSAGYVRKKPKKAPRAGKPPPPDTLSDNWVKE